MAAQSVREPLARLRKDGDWSGARAHTSIFFALAHAKNFDRVPASGKLKYEAISMMAFNLEYQTNLVVDLEDLG